MITLPLTLPAPDASDTEVREHFRQVGLVFAGTIYDDAIRMCSTCCRSEENVFGRAKSPSGRARFDTAECEALYERRHGANAPALNGDDEGDDEMAKARKGIAASARGRKARRGAAPKTKAAVATKVAKPKAAAKPSSNGTAPKGETLDPKALKVGMSLEARHKGDTYAAKVVVLGDGVGVSYGGSTYKSLSAAGTAITGSAVNGRRFWRIA